jgi:16S rRNA (guanine527-N7)-methyltransferase
MAGDNRHERQGLQRQLGDGLAGLRIVLDRETQDRLLAFLELLRRWSRVYNLTAVTSPREMLVRHVLDSLSIAADLQGPRILDVGTGAGLPGIPLSLACPESEFILLDSSGKKVRFVTQAVAELGLRNVAVAHARVEEYRVPPVDTIVVRAFASLSDLLPRVAHLTHRRTQLLAMKGRFPDEELAALPCGFVVDGVRRVRVPGLLAQRHVVRLSTGQDRVPGP